MVSRMLTPRKPRKPTSIFQSDAMSFALIVAIVVLAYMIVGKALGWEYCCNLATLV